MAAAAAAGGFKLVLLGEGRVGKTSLVVKFVRDAFDDKQASSMDASCLEKKVSVGGHTFTLNIWDTAGQERFHALTPLYYRDADGALLVYDITDMKSFERVKHWVNELRKMASPTIKIVICGNKSDMERSRKVDKDAADTYARDVGATHFLTSAKMGDGVKEAFADLTKRIASTKGAGGAGAGSAARSGRRGGRRSDRGGAGGDAGPTGPAARSQRASRLVVVDDGPSAAAPSSGGCC